MKTLSIEEISRTDSQGLKSLIDYWSEYDSETILLSFAELKRRDFKIKENTVKLLQEFCVNNNQVNIDEFLESYLKSKGFNSTEDYIDKKEIVSEVAITSNEFNNSNQNNVNKYPALKTISGIYSVLAWLIGIITFGVTIILLNTGDYGIMGAIFTFVIGSLLVIGVLATAELITLFIDIEYNTRQNKT